MGYWWQQLRKHPTRLLVGGFAAAVLAGGMLLTLRVSASGPRIGFLDALFTATSAVCVGERLETAVLLVHHLNQMQVPQILVKLRELRRMK